MPKTTLKKQTFILDEELTLPTFTGPLPSYILRIKSLLADLVQKQEAQDENARLLDNELAGLNPRLIAVDADETEAFHKLAFAHERASMLERRAALLEEAIAEASRDLFNANSQSRDRMKVVASKHDQHRDEQEIREKQASGKTGGLSHDELVKKAKGWPKLTRDRADQITWDDAKPELAARKIIKLAEDIFSDLPDLAKES